MTLRRPRGPAPFLAVLAILATLGAARADRPRRAPPMPENKTKPTRASVAAFIDRVPNATPLADVDRDVLEALIVADWNGPQPSAC